MTPKTRGVTKIVGPATRARAPRDARKSGAPGTQKIFGGASRLLK
jgi:hypothetical protein